MNNIEYTSTGLQCDNPECDWVDATIDDDMLEIHIDTMCPKCGQNLLTMEDYNNTIALRNTIELVNKLTPEQLNQLNDGIDMRLFENLPLFKDVDLTKPIELEITTHDGIKFNKVKNVEGKDI